MSGDFTVLPGLIVGGGKLISYTEIREKVQSLGKVTNTPNGFRVIPFSSNEEALDFDEMYPVVYFNRDYTIDVYITGMKYENVKEFLGKLADVLGVPIRCADMNGNMEEDEDELKKLEKFYESLGGYYGKGKQDNVP